MKQYLFVVILTATITLVLAWAVWQLSMRYKLYPGIRERDVHKTPTPRLGGVAMYLGIVAAFLASSQHPFFSIFWADPAAVWAILGATTLIVLVGVADDIWDLDWMIKLGAQFAAAGIIAWFGKLQILSLPIGGLTVGSSWMSFVLTVLAIVVVMNAVNFIDGLDGLVAGVALIANGVFFAYSYLLVRDAGATTYFNLASFIAAALIGACIGFLPLNWTPAKLFMGDSGALMLGLLMAVSAIAITGQITPSQLDPDNFGRSQLLGAFIPILLPITIVLLPLLDFGLAIIRRVGAGKSPFSPDRKHLHHRMLDMGHSDRTAVLIFYSWTAIVGLSMLLMYIGTASDWPGEYLLGVGFGVLGAIACLVVTLMPPGAPSRARHPSPGGLVSTVSSTPILRTTVIWSAIVTGALAVVGAVVGYLVAAESGLWSALLGVLLAAVFLGITSVSILIANRWFGTDLYVPIFFGIVLGGWLLKFIVFLVVLFVVRGQPWVNEMVFFIAIVVGVLASLAVDVIVLARMRLPYASDTTLPTVDPDDTSVRE